MTYLAIFLTEVDNGILIELTSDGENVKFKSQIGNLMLCLEVLREESRGE